MFTLSWNFHINVIIVDGIPIHTPAATLEGLMYLFGAIFQHCEDSFSFFAVLILL